jgi:Cu+-exporting ATPase
MDGPPLRIPLTGLRCAGCARTVERALLAVPGVQAAAVQLSEESAQLTRTGEPSATAAALIAAVEAAGYGVPRDHFELAITGLRCASCVARAERALTHVDGVEHASVSLADESAIITAIAGATTREALTAALTAVGLGALDLDRAAPIDAEAEAREREQRAHLDRLRVGVLLTVPLMILGMGRDFDLLGAWASESWVLWLLFALAAPVQVILGAPHYRGALAALRHRSANMDVLVALGSTVAFIASVLVAIALTRGSHALGHHVYFEAGASILTLIGVGRWLEARARGRSGAAIRELMALRPATAIVLRGGVEQEIPQDSVRVGDHVLVRPGAAIPVDGRVLAGRSEVDESMLTGESALVLRAPGDPVTGGAINGLGALTVEAQRVGAATTLARIIRLVREAQASKPAVQARIDQITAVFVPVILALALLTLVIWLALGAAPAAALMRLVAVLVIACPCALGLATPTAIVVGVGLAAQHGILFRRTAALEQICAVKTIVLDKTGTLTVGRPTIQAATFADPQIEPEAWSLAYALASASDHPLSRAIAEAAATRGDARRRAVDVQTIGGRGVIGMIDGDRLLLGAPALLEAESIVAPPWLTAAIERESERGRALVILAREGRPLALFALADAPRPGARAAIAALRARGLRIAVLTGDHAASAAAIAEAVGIAPDAGDLVLAGLSPGDKSAAIKRLQAEGHGPVAMVGDGINDAPALAIADVGVAIGGGADVAMETADITLMGGELAGLVRAREIGEATLRTLHQNLFWAFAYNITLIPIAAGVLYPITALPAALRELHPALAAAAMALSSVTVVLNSLRLRRA